MSTLDTSPASAGEGGSDRPHVLDLGDEVPVKALIFAMGPNGAFAEICGERVYLERERLIADAVGMTLQFPKELDQ